jgi:hypothetical protein
MSPKSISPSMISRPAPASLGSTNENETASAKQMVEMHAGSPSEEMSSEANFTKGGSSDGSMTSTIVPVNRIGTIGDLRTNRTIDFSSCHLWQKLNASAKFKTMEDALAYFISPEFAEAFKSTPLRDTLPEDIRQQCAKYRHTQS